MELHQHLLKVAAFARENSLGGERSKDLSQDALIQIALAYEAVSYLRLRKDPEFQAAAFLGTIINYLQRSFRNMLVIRAQLPADELDTTYITKLGRINEQ